MQCCSWTICSNPLYRVLRVWVGCGYCISDVYLRKQRHKVTADPRVKKLIIIWMQWALKLCPIFLDYCFCDRKICTYVHSRGWQHEFSHFCLQFLLLDLNMPMKACEFQSTCSLEILSPPLFPFPFPLCVLLSPLPCFPRFFMPFVCPTDFQY